MNYCKIKKYDIANGPGIRLSLFVAGCPYHCEGCFNQTTWDYNSGELFDDTVIKTILKEIELPCYKGFSLLGGEPFQQTIVGTQQLISLCQAVKGKRPDFSIWAWTGGTFDDILANKQKRELLEQIDVLIDGPFMINKKDLRLQYCGSTNQRVIDVKKSLNNDTVILWGA